MEKGQKYWARKGFLVREIAGETMLIPTETGGIHLTEPDEDLPEFNGMIQLDEVGEFLWNEIQKPKTIDELTEAVRQEYETEGQDVESDILEFLDTGIKNQIIFIVKNNREE